MIRTTLLSLLLFSGIYSQNLRTFTLFTCASVVKNNAALEVNEKYVEKINNAFLESLNKSGSIQLIIGGEKGKSPKSFHEILEMIDSRADSNDFGIYNIIAGWKPEVNTVYSLINSESLEITFNYLLNFLRMNAAKNQLLVLLMPKGSIIPAGAAAVTTSDLSPGTNILFIRQDNQSSFDELVSEYISAIESIENISDSDLNKDGVINISEYYAQLLKELRDEKINFETVHLENGTDLNLREVK